MRNLGVDTVDKFANRIPVTSIQVIFKAGNLFQQRDQSKTTVRSEDIAHAIQPDAHLQIKISVGSR